MVKFDPEIVSRVVRSYVIVFSAGNTAALPFIGRVMDWGETTIERHMWKYDITLIDSLVISVALLAIAFARSWVLYLSIALVGFCYGTWFSSTPALMTLWFGVPQFPRNFGLISSFMGLGSATLASTIPLYLHSAFGEWTSLPVVGGLPNEVHNVCTELMSTILSFCMLAAIQTILLAYGHRLRSFVQAKMEIYTY